jgi:lysophospholipase L1-like esterase
MSRNRRGGLPGAFGELLNQLPINAVVASMPQPQAAAAEVNAQLAEAASKDRVTVVDLRDSGPTSWRGKLAADHFHPNDLGYTGLAEAFHQPVLAALTNRPKAP